MLKSSLYQIIKSLTKKEIGHINDVLAKKYLNLRQDVKLLFEFLTQTSHNSDFSKKDVFKSLYPSEGYSDSKLRKVIYLLKLEIEENLIHFSLGEDSIQKAIYLSRQYLKRGITKSFNKSLEAARYEVLNSSTTAGDQLLKQYEIHQLKYEFEKNTKREQLNYLPKMINEVKNFYMLEVLKWACNIQSHASISATQYTMVEIDEALSFAKNNLNAPALKLYFLIYQAGKDSATPEDFELLKKALNEERNYFAPKEIREMYLLSINHCIRQLNTGSKSYLQEAFNLYEDALANQILYENGKLSTFTYKNIMNVALALGKNEWAFNFLNEQKDRLPSDIQENTFAANLATYYYKIGSLREAIDLLREVQFLDVFDNLKYRTLLARIYFELGEHTALEHHLESFASYLYRQKKLGYHKSLYQNLIRTMRKILHSNLRDATTRDKLVKEILSSEQLAEKSWLVRQLEV